MKRIVKSNPKENEIAVDSIPLNVLESSFIISVYEKRVSFIYQHTNDQWGGYRPMGGITKWHSVSDTLSELINKHFPIYYSENPLYMFDNLQDFAIEVLKNGWKLDGEK